MELFSDDWSVCPDDVNNYLIIPAMAQRHRVEALRKTIASLDARVKNETHRLGVIGHKESLTHTRHTSYKHEASDRKKKKEEKTGESIVSINVNEPMKKEIQISVGKWSLPDK